MIFSPSLNLGKYTLFTLTYILKIENYMEDYEIWSIRHVRLGMTILHRPASNRPAPHGFYPPCKGGGAGTGQDFCHDYRGGAVMGIGIDPPWLAQPRLLFIILQKYP